MINKIKILLLQSEKCGKLICMQYRGRTKIYKLTIVYINITIKNKKLQVKLNFVDD